MRRILLNSALCAGGRPEVRSYRTSVRSAGFSRNHSQILTGPEYLRRSHQRWAGAPPSGFPCFRRTLVNSAFLGGCGSESRPPHISGPIDRISEKSYQNLGRSQISASVESAAAGRVLGEISTVSLNSAKFRLRRRNGGRNSGCIEPSLIRQDFCEIAAKSWNVAHICVSRIRGGWVGSLLANIMYYG